MRNKYYKPLIIVLLLIPIASLAAEDIYKWTDNDGKAHFGSLPPSDNKAIKLKMEPINSIKRPKHNPPPLVTGKSSETEAIIPAQKYEAFYKNNETKYVYETRDGDRINPTYEYYNNGELKQKWVYNENLLDEPIHIKNHLTITSVSIVKEHRDSLKLNISYEFFINDTRSWLHIRPKPAKYINKKKLWLKKGQHSGQMTKTLSQDAPSSFQSDVLLCRLYDGRTREWVTIGHIDLIKIWKKNF